MAVVFRPRRPQLGAGTTCSAAGSRKASCSFRSSRAAWATACRCRPSEVVRHLRDRRHALRYGRPDPAGARRRRHGRLPGQRRRHRAVVGDGLPAERPDGRRKQRQADDQEGQRAAGHRRARHRRRGRGAGRRRTRLLRSDQRHAPCRACRRRISPGEVSGNVKADIPLQKGIDRDRLDWLVALDYKNLSIAKPIDGQMVTEADGSITVEPTQGGDRRQGQAQRRARRDRRRRAARPRATPSASASSRSSSTTRRARRSCPALAELVEGTVKVALDMPKAAASRWSKPISPTRKLDIPWAGWSKGPGIAGRCQLRAGECRTASRRLSDFNLTGKSFGVDGSVTLVGRQPRVRRTSASVRLNRGDDVAVSVKQSGKGYAVDINGESLDARSLVKQFTADTGTATKAAQQERLRFGHRRREDADRLSRRDSCPTSSSTTAAPATGWTGSRSTAVAASGADGRNSQRRRRRRPHHAHDVGRRRRDPALPRHLRAHGRRHDRRCR